MCGHLLKGGDWVGRGATKFYREMDSDVLPTVKLLGAALQQAGRLTRMIGQVMKQAEEEAATLLRYLGRGGDIDGGKCRERYPDPLQAVEARVGPRWL